MRSSISRSSCSKIITAVSVKTISSLQFAKLVLQSTPFDTLQCPSTSIIFSEPSTGRCFGIQPVNWHLSYTQITTFVLKKLQHSTFKKLSFDRLLCRNPPPFGGSVSLALPYTVHSSPYQNHFIIVQLSVAETPHLLVGPWVWLYLIQFNRQLL